MTSAMGETIGGPLNFQSGERSGQQIQDEAQLLAFVRSGDEDACEALVRQHGGRMLAVARRFLRSEEDSADAVQDSFLAAFRSLDSFAGNSGLGTWLHRIVVNTCLMRLRSRSRSHQVSIQVLPGCDEMGRQARPVQPWEEPPVTRLTREETRAQVRACIDRLPSPYRTVLLMRDIEELDTDQTARHLGINTGAVKTRLHRARQALRTLLEPLVEAGERSSASNKDR
jgi:RNA polymerase sigma-70 factor, ECF subfamily